MDELSNEELFNSALSDEASIVTEPEAPVVDEGADPTKVDDRPRDEQGRFIEKIEEPKPVEQEVKPEQAEPVGVRQLREALERAERRAVEAERKAQPQPEPVAKPDIFENPDGAIKAGVQEALTPIERQFASFIETVSRKDAVREHGQETVTEAFKTLDQAASTGDPQALAVVQAVKKSMDPFGDIVSWYRGNEASRNPDAFFQRRLEESLKDEKFKGELLTKLQPSEGKPKPVINIPPSLSRAASAASSLSEGGDLSNEHLFAHALR